MTKTLFKFDETIVKDAVTNNLPRLTDTIEYIVMDIMQAHCAEFDTDEDSINPDPHFTDTAMNTRAYLEACWQVATLTMQVLPDIVKEYNAPFILPSDAIETAYQFLDKDLHTDE